MKKRMIALVLVAIVVYVLVGRNVGIKYRLGKDLQLDLFLVVCLVPCWHKV